MASREAGCDEALLKPTTSLIVSVTVMLAEGREMFSGFDNEVVR